MAERPDDISELELARFLDGLPRRYLSVFGLATIYRHVRLARGLLPGELHASLEKRDDIWELTVAALDKPYLFSNIAGVLSYFGMDIHRGQAMTTPDHLVLDVFEFSDEEGLPAAERRRRARRSRACSRAPWPARVDVAALLRGPRAERRCTAAAATWARTSTSTTSTRSATRSLEIVTDDAPGLLLPDQPRRLRSGVRRGPRADLDRRTQGHRRAARDEARAASWTQADQALLKRELERTLEGSYEAD